MGNCLHIRKFLLFFVLALCLNPTSHSQTILLEELEEILPDQPISLDQARRMADKLEAILKKGPPDVKRVIAHLVAAKKRAVKKSAIKKLECKEEVLCLRRENEILADIINGFDIQISKISQTGRVSEVEFNHSIKVALAHVVSAALIGVFIELHGIAAKAEIITPESPILTNVFRSKIEASDYLGAEPREKYWFGGRSFNYFYRTDKYVVEVNGLVLVDTKTTFAQLKRFLSAEDNTDVLSLRHPRRGLYKTLAYVHREKPSYDCRFGLSLICVVIPDIYVTDFTLEL